MDSEERKPVLDLDEPVNVDMEPEDALRVLLGEERREASTTDEGKEGISANPSESSRPS